LHEEGTQREYREVIVRALKFVIFNNLTNV
jgi:hypothetical protein